ncbi:LysR family transcriptional regulator [Nocardia sp. CA2R105]|uniref:LysR family transcriptional regulator n=1 Tax=Nocardia coffeae TaxID=2873381 RepID=UPI001CA75813|nr:LysR family transcriptional regulator [Nocardia coffeae]MBY8858033.1 LysR family transcriptional regulator [Nocardia coffeae]
MRTRGPDQHRLLHGLTFDQLHAIRTIAATGSFREASKILCLTQPAISQRVRQIERMLGAPIFERHSGVGVTLTAAGETILQFCERSMLSLDELAADLESALAPPNDSELRIMAPSDLIEYVLLPMLAPFHSRQPHVEVRVRQSVDRAEIVNMLSSGKVDLAFDRSPTHPSLTTLARMNEHLYLVAPSDHELLKLSPKDRPAAIADHPFVTYAPGMRTWNLTQRWAAKVGATIVPTIETRNVALMKHAIKQYGTLSILPGVAVSQEIQDGSMVAVEIADMPLTRTTAIAAHPGEDQAPAIHSFVEELVAAYAQRSDTTAAEIRWVAPQQESATS